MLSELRLLYQATILEASLQAANNPEKISTLHWQEHDLNIILATYAQYIGSFCLKVMPNTHFTRITWILFLGLQTTKMLLEGKITRPMEDVTGYFTYEFSAAGKHKLDILYMPRKLQVIPLPLGVLVNWTKERILEYCPWALIRAYCTYY